VPDAKKIWFQAALTTYRCPKEAGARSRGIGRPDQASSERRTSLQPGPL